MSDTVAERRRRPRHPPQLPKEHQVSRPSSRRSAPPNAPETAPMNHLGRQYSPQRIDKPDRISAYVRIQVSSAGQSRGILADESAELRGIVARAVVVETRTQVVFPTRELQRRCGSPEPPTRSPYGEYTCWQQ